MIDQMVLASVDLVHSVDCRKEAFVSGLGDAPIVSAVCRLPSLNALRALANFSEIRIGGSPDNLRPITPAKGIDGYMAKLGKVAEDHFDKNPDGLESHQLDSQKKRYLIQISNYERRMTNNFLSWEELQKRRNGYIAIASIGEPPSVAYFQFVFTNGTESRVIRKGFRN